MCFHEVFLDSARLEEIEYALDVLDIDGVTANPRHVQISGKPFMTDIKEISKLVEGIDKSVSVEVNPHCMTFDEIVNEAEELAGISEDFVIKLQCIDASIKAIIYLAKKGIRVNLILVFSAVQALFAMRVGASFVSPFIGWKESNGEDVISYTEEVSMICENFRFDTEIIVAAVRNGRQITNAAVAGVDIVTTGLDVFMTAIDHPYTRDGIIKFQGFWDKTSYD